MPIDICPHIGKHTHTQNHSEWSHILSLPHPPSHLRHGLSLEPWLSGNSFCRSRWPPIQRSSCFCLPSPGTKGATMACLHGFVIDVWSVPTLGLPWISVLFLCVDNCFCTSPMRIVTSLWGAKLLDGGCTIYTHSALLPEGFMPSLVSLFLLLFWEFYTRGLCSHHFHLSCLLQVLPCPFFKFMISSLSSHMKTVAVIFSSHSHRHVLGGS